MHHKVGHLRKRQRHHDEVHAFGAQRQRAHHQRIQARRQHRSGQQPQQRSGLGLGRQQHGHVGANAKERGLAKAHQPRPAHQQLQAEGKDGVNHDLAHQIDAKVAAEKRKSCQCDKEDRHKGELGCFVMGHCISPL